jgi:transketolase
MRKQFFSTIEKLAIQDDKIIFLTGDVGFMAIEPLQKAIGDRVINCGVAEANMVSMAAGMASQGLKPIVYSIAPFVTHRVAEQLKIDVCLHNMNVKIVGNGGGYGYGVMGPTHHAIEDIALMSSLQNMKCYVPCNNHDVEPVVSQMYLNNGPAYLRLGYGESTCIWEQYYPIRKLEAGNKATIIGLGPVVLNARDLDCDVYAISEIPCSLDTEVMNSISRTGKLIIIEEHVARGGLGEYLALKLYENPELWRDREEPLSIKHLCAKGYPSGLYGSQEYHQKENGLDKEAICKVLSSL